MLKSSTSTSVAHAAGAAESTFVTRNAATTVGCAVVATVPVLGTVGMVLGAPGTTAILAGIGGAGIYLGHRQANDLPIIPGRKSQDDSKSPATPARVVADDTADADVSASPHTAVA